MKVKVNNKEFEVCDSKVVTHNNHWDYINAGKWEPHTFKIFDEFLDKRYPYIDLGAWIGSTVLYGAQLASRVYAIEPDHIALETLKGSIQLNPSLASKIVLFEGCISDKDGTVSMTGNGDSKSKLAPYGNMTVKSMTFDTFVMIYDIAFCNFIKMDIEGAETLVIPTMKSFLEEVIPVLYISFHPWCFTEKNKRRMLDALSGYSKAYNALTMKAIPLGKIFDFREVLLWK